MLNVDVKVRNWNRLQPILDSKLDPSMFRSSLIVSEPLPQFAKPEVYSEGKSRLLFCFPPFHHLIQSNLQ